jgi:excisionase family DNA binding protein
MAIELFPDQQEALDKVLTAIDKQPVGGKALVVAPTAWGSVFTPKEASTLLHIHDATVVRMIKRGDLEGFEVCINNQTRYRVKVESVMRYIKAHPPKQKEKLPPNQKRCNTCEEIRAIKFFLEGRNKCNECRKKEYREKYAINPQYGKALSRKLKYGISQEEYDQMFTAQSGLCASCGQPETTMRRSGTLDTLSVDHCHTTGAVRGLLCANCNRALGLLHENPEKIKALLRYVEERVLY